jgi:hypothetical protein
MDAKPKSTAERVAEHDARLHDAGGATIHRLRLTPEATAALQRITERTGESRTAAINRLLANPTNGK